MNPRKINIHENKILIAVVLVADVIISNLLYWLFCSFVKGGMGLVSMRQTMVAGTIIYLACTMHNGVVLYHHKVSNHQIVMRVMQNVFTYAVLSFLLFTLGGFSHLPVVWMIAFWMSFVVCSAFFRIFFRKLVVMWRSSSRNVRNVVFVGSSDNAANILREMTETPTLGYHALGYFDYEPNAEFAENCPYLGKPSDVESYLNSQKNVHELYCCLPSKDSDDILHIIHYCLNHLIHFYSLPNVSNYQHHRVHLKMFGDVPYLSLFNEPLASPENRFIKRLFDIAVSLTFLCTLFPLIFIVVTIITKVTMPGPVFFRQKRTGLDGKDFYCLKFRSMKVNKDADTLQATLNDPRKTKWGNIMRKTSIDELPQFINVLCGSMSVVGPRPHMVKQTADYSRLIDNYMVRHYIKPGITGWSQVTGFRGETKLLSEMEGRVRGDIWYIEHWSVWLDMYIMYKTVANAVHGDKQAF